MKKSILKKATIFILMLVILSLYVTPVFAFPLFPDPDPVGIINANDWQPGPLTETDVGTWAGKANIIMGIVRVVGIIVSVVALAMIGIKYMTGSVQEKAEYKKTLFPYLVGATLLFATSFFVQALYDWVITLNN